jgi:capsular polysaccharide biosynthesis protein
VRVHRLLSASPMFSMPAYVHPRITDTWDLIGESLRSQAPERDYPRRIFCSRKHDKRPCRNRDEVEALFVDQGFEVLFAEDYPLPEQAQLFHRADVVAGYAGSALFNVMFSDRRKHIIAVGSASYRASNEYMIAAVRGHKLDLVTCEPEIAQPATGFSKKAFESPYTCDMEREGAWLREILAAL